MTNDKNDLLDAEMNYRKREVAWYRRNGRFRTRICKDSSGKEYVVGDFSWNLRRPVNQQEFIEKLMANECLFEEAQKLRAELRAEKKRICSA